MRKIDSLKGENMDLVWKKPLPPRPEFLNEWLESGKNLEVEIGCGKGKFLVARAQVEAEKLFLGIDRAGRFMKRGIEKSSKRQLFNIHFLKWDAFDILQGYLPENSVDIFHMYFPDPWPKRKHQDRKLFHAEYLKLIFSRLKKSGLFECATDHKEYFEIMQKVLANVALPWSHHRESVNKRLFAPEFKTNFELKYEKEGRPLYYFELGK